MIQMNGFDNLLVGISALEDESEAPRFTKIMSNLKVTQGRVAVFEVAVVGKPQPIVSWLKDNQALAPAHEYQVTSLKEGSVTGDHILVVDVLSRACADLDSSELFGVEPSLSL